MWVFVPATTLGDNESSLRAGRVGGVCWHLRACQVIKPAKVILRFGVCNTCSGVGTRASVVADKIFCCSLRASVRRVSHQLSDPVLQ